MKFTLAFGHSCDFPQSDVTYPSLWITDSVPTRFQHHLGHVMSNWGRSQKWVFICIILRQKFKKLCYQSSSSSGYKLSLSSICTCCDRHPMSCGQIFYIMLGNSSFVYCIRNFVYHTETLHIIWGVFLYHMGSFAHLMGSFVYHVHGKFCVPHGKFCISHRKFLVLHGTICVSYRKFLSHHWEVFCIKWEVLHTKKKILYTFLHHPY